MARPCATGILSEDEQCLMSYRQSQLQSWELTLRLANCDAVELTGFVRPACNRVQGWDTQGGSGLYIFVSPFDDEAMPTVFQY